MEPKWRHRLQTNFQKYWIFSRKLLSTVYDREEVLTAVGMSELWGVVIASYGQLCHGPGHTLDI